MIKFFRQIRQKLLQENRFSKYLFYALGEIILVVIGILLALQIDTWNTHKNNRAKELVYLKSYHEDLKKNITELNRVIEKSNRTIGASDSLLRLATGQLEVEDIKTMEGLVMESLNYTLFLSQEGTIKDIFGTGDLALIQNDTIRKSMVNWNSDLKYLTEYEALGKDNQLQCVDYLSNETPFYRMALTRNFMDVATKDKMLSDQRFLNLVSNQQHMARVLNGLYVEKKLSMMELQKAVTNAIPIP